MCQPDCSGSGESWRKNHHSGCVPGAQRAHSAVSLVGVAHQCWASRGSEALIDEEGVRCVTPHLEEPEATSLRDRVSLPLRAESMGGRTYELSAPVSDADIVRLRAGDIVCLNGTLCTARDRLHRRRVSNLEKGEDIPPEILNSKAVFHCGPVAAWEACGWRVNAAGPTTSSRFTNEGAVLAERSVFNLTCTAAC